MLLVFANVLAYVSRWWGDRGLERESESTPQEFRAGAGRERRTRPYGANQQLFKLISYRWWQLWSVPNLVFDCIYYMARETEKSRPTQNPASEIFYLYRLSE